MPDDARLDWSTTEEDELFLMSNLYPRHTGLPMTVWVQVKGGARHDARVKVGMSHGARANVDDMAVVSVRPEPRLLHGALDRRDLEAVRTWITLNRDVIVDHWEGRADTVDLIERLQRLPG